MTQKGGEICTVLRCAVVLTFAKDDANLERFHYLSNIDTSLRTSLGIISFVAMTDSFK